MDKILITILKDIKQIKLIFTNILIKIEILEDNVFILIDSIEISNNKSYQELIYDFKNKYLNMGYSNIFWGVDTSIRKSKRRTIHAKNLL